MHAFAGRVEVVSHSSCRTSAIFKYFCPLAGLYFSEAIVKDRPEIDWDDIVGLDGVKIELRELSKEPGKYCKGILVFGVSLISFNTSDS